MTRFQSLLCLAAFCGVTSTARWVPAQTSSADKAAAEALFNQAVAAVERGELEQGCNKFEASQALDPALGTTLRLADCYERSGKSASAWALFKEAEGMARRASESEREAIAKERAAALLPRLSYLTIQLDGAGAPGLALTRNGAPIPLPALGTEIPVDPGVVEVVASAPGFRDWLTRVAIASTPDHHTVTVPKLERLPPSQAAPVTTALPAQLTPGGMPSASVPADEPPSRAQRNVGITLTTIGATAVLTGAGFGWYAMSENERSRTNRYCPTDDHNGCTREGVALRQRAHDFARVSTVVGIAGGALLVTGVVLWTAAPSARSRASRSEWRLSAVCAPGSAYTAVGADF